MQRIRLHGMRSLWTFVLLATLTLTAACSAPQDPAPTGLTSPPAAEAGAPAASSDSRAAAAAVAQRLLASGSGFAWLESPRAVAAEELSYAQAIAKIGVGEPQFNLWPADTRVWLVVLEGRWLLTPMGPIGVTPQPIQYEGCLFALFTVGDERMISAGDAVCPAAP